MHPRLAAPRASQRYALLPADSKRRLDLLIPALARASAATPDPGATLARGVDLVVAIASRAAYLALLAENPKALDSVARIIGASSWAAEFVTRHPLLLDELLDDRLLHAQPDVASFSRNLRSQLEAARGDTERGMNLMREAHQAPVFRLLAQDLAGLLTVEVIALAAFVAPLHVLAMFAGAKVFHFASEQTYRRVAYVIITLAALVSMPLWDKWLR